MELSSRKQLVESIQKNVKSIDVATVQNEDIVILKAINGLNFVDSIQVDDSIILSDKLFTISESMGMTDEADQVWEMADAISRGAVTARMCANVTSCLRQQYGGLSV